jgi:hypothetical protein
MTMRVELRNVCTSTGRPRTFSIGAPADANQLRKGLASLEPFRVDPSLTDAVLLITDDTGFGSGVWSRDGIQRLNELFTDEFVPTTDPFFDLREAVELAAEPPDPFFASAKEYVTWQAAQTKEAGAPRPGRWDFLVSHGRDFVRAALPDDLAKGPQRECFRNAVSAVSENPARYRYVEGIAGGKGGPGGGPDFDFKPHAWVTSDDGRAIDVTWPLQREPPSYFGIEFDNIDFVKTMLEDRGGYGVLGRDGSAEEILPLLDLFSDLE